MRGERPSDVTGSGGLSILSLTAQFREHLPERTRGGFPDCGLGEHDREYDFHHLCRNCDFSQGILRVCLRQPACNLLAGLFMTKPDAPPHKGKKIYQKPELKVINPQAAIEKLRPLALAGDRTARQLIQFVRHKHDIH